MPYLTAGQTAPDFTLPDQNNQQVSLQQLLQTQRVLIYFYPKAMTPGCTVQACAIRDNQAAFDELNVKVVGISTDSPARLAKFATRDNLPFMLLADEQHLVAEEYGVWGPKKFMGKEYDGLHRISFLINQDGTIAKVFDTFKTNNHHQVVLSYLQA